ncbi:MAG: TIGR02757 family protein [Bacteroidia bacterium]
MKPAELKEFLDEKYELYNKPVFIESDPISVPHRFTQKEDIEIAAFFAATLAWGQRPTIIRNGLKLMEMMDSSPFEYIKYSNKKDWKAFSKFSHRTFNGTDAIYFIQSLQHIYTQLGGLENAFRHPADMHKGLIQFREVFLGKYPAGRTAKHIADVTKNASAKRLNMFLRWMVRNDKHGVDFGIWKSISPAQLYCPIDLHSGRVARRLGLLKRQQNDWKAVDELTQNLRSLDLKDPVKYDFALFGLGVFEKF